MADKWEASLIQTLPSLQNLPTLQKLSGCPVASNKNSLTAGPNGPVLLQDVHLLEKLTQFTREKIPSRNVHALGCGAYGTLTVTHDITEYSVAKLFSTPGKTTELFVRFSGINHPESLHMVMMVYTDRDGTPMSYRMMHGYGCNTFSFLNEKMERFWVKFHLLSFAGAGEDPNFLSNDLYNAIARGDFPKWRFSFQIMSEDQGYKNPITFDCTKVWNHDDFPLHDIGVLELNRNIVDHFAEVEQVAFSPANVVPGFGFSPDKLLQGRLLIYDDAQHHRIGPNFKQLFQVKGLSGLLKRRSNL